MSTHMILSNYKIIPSSILSITSRKKYYLYASARTFSMCVTFLIPKAIVYPSIELSSKLKASASPSTQTRDFSSPKPAYC